MYLLRYWLNPPAIDSTLALPARLDRAIESDQVASIRTSALDRKIALQIVLAALGFRLLSAFIALLVNVAFPLHQHEQFTVFSSTSPFWDTFARYDSGQFLNIAWSGYSPVPGGRSNIAYFPLYPMLIRWVGGFLVRHRAYYYMAGVGISWVCFITAMVGLYYLARLDLPVRQARRAVMLMAVFPFAFFFGVAYSESTFVVFAILAFYFFRTKRWFLGGCCGALATATRVPGILMVPALAWIAWQSTVNGRDRLRAAAAVILAASGFGAYCAYIYARTGNPLEWAATLQRWGYYPGGSPLDAPIALLRALATHPYQFLVENEMAPYDTLYGLCGIAFVIATPFVWKRLGTAYGGFMALNLYLPLSSGTFEGVGRYCAVLFPCFVWLASLRSPFVSSYLPVIFALFYTLGLAFFTTIHPLF